MVEKRTAGPGPYEGKEGDKEAADQAQRSAEITDLENTVKEAGKKIVEAVDPDKKESPEEKAA